MKALNHPNIGQLFVGRHLLQNLIQTKHSSDYCRLDDFPINGVSLVSSDKYLMTAVKTCLDGQRCQVIQTDMHA